MIQEPGRTTRAGLSILIASILVAALLSMHDTWVVDPDSAAYVGLGRALASGRGYTFAGIPHTKYPPFFPVLLALAIRAAGPEAFRVMQCIPALSWILSLVLVYRFFSGKGIERAPFARQGLPRTRAAGLALALLTAASIYMIQYAVVFLRTETVFLLLSIGALYAACGMEGGRRPGPGRMLAFALLFQCAVLTRLAGAVMLPALAAALLLRKGSWLRAPGGLGRGLLLLLLCLPGPVLWIARNATVRAEGATGYLEEFTQRYGLDLTKNRDLEMEPVDPAGLAERVAENGSVFAASCAKLLINSNKGGARAFLGLGAATLCLAGLAGLLLRRRSVVDLYVLFYLLLYLAWPFNQQQRFYMPIFPFLLEYAGFSAGLLGRRVLPRLLRVRGAPSALLVVEAGLVAGLLAGRSKTPHLFGRYSVQYFAFTLAAALVFAATAAWLILRRARPWTAENAARSAARLAPALYLAVFSALGFHQAAAVIPGNHARFLEERDARPPPPALARIEVHPEFLHLASWIMEHTDRGDVIMCDVPKMLHLLTGRPTVPFTFYGKSRRLAAEVLGRRPAYVYYSGEIDWIYRIFKESCERAGYEKVFSRWVDVGGGEKIEPALYRVPRQGN